MNKTDIDGYFFFDADLMPENPAVMEIGAYSAHAVAPVLNRYPHASFSVIEASPLCFRMLKTSTEPYNVHVINLAIADKDDYVTLNEYAEGLDANSTFDRKSEGLTLTKATKIMGLTLPSLLEISGFTYLDLLLVNCEGCEVYILKQLIASQSLRNKVRQICLSFHCDHVKIYPTQVRDDLLWGIGPHYEITKGTDAVGYYLMVRK